MSKLSIPIEDIVQYSFLMTTPHAPPTDHPAAGFRDATPLLASPEKLRARAEEDGFLFFKQFLPPGPLLDLRRQIIDIVARRGWIRPGTDPMDGVADLVAIADADRLDPSLRYIGVTHEVYREIQRLELFHSLPHDPRIVGLYEALFDGPVFVHPRHIARVLLPSPSFTPTPPHQDYIYIQSLRPHMDVITWEEIYSGWKSDRLKYYWNNRPMRLAAWDASLLADNPRKEKIC